MDNDYKNYIKNHLFIAETIKSSLINERGDASTLRGLAYQFIGRFKSLAPTFDEYKFFTACGFDNRKINNNL